MQISFIKRAPIQIEYISRHTKSFARQILGLKKVAVPFIPALCLIGPSIICLGLIHSTPRDLYRRLIFIQQVIGERLLELGSRVYDVASHQR